MEEEDPPEKPLRRRKKLDRREAKNGNRDNMIRLLSESYDAETGRGFKQLEISKVVGCTVR